MPRASGRAASSAGARRPSQRLASTLRMASRTCTMLLRARRTSRTQTRRGAGSRRAPGTRDQVGSGHRKGGHHIPASFARLGSRGGAERSRGPRAAQNLARMVSSPVRPPRRLISCMPVGLVTLISVRNSPSTSTPTKNWPALAEERPQGERKKKKKKKKKEILVAGAAAASAPGCRQHGSCCAARRSAGTRITAPIGSPSTNKIRLLAVAWRRARTLARSSRCGPSRVASSNNVLRFGSPSRAISTSRPPNPNTGFRIICPPSSARASCRSPMLRSKNVRGMNSGEVEDRQLPAQVAQPLRLIDHQRVAHRPVQAPGRRSRSRGRPAGPCASPPRGSWPAHAPAGRRPGRAARRVRGAQEASARATASAPRRSSPRQLDRLRLVTPPRGPRRSSR